MSTNSIQIPKTHISWSQLDLFERSPAEYAKRYIYGEQWAGNEYTDLGRLFAEAVEHNKSDDPIISFLIQSLPKYPQREYEMRVPISINAQKITLLAKIDGIDVKNKNLGEYKTGKKWTQERAKACEQLKFYHLVYWMMYRTMLDNIYLYWAETAKNKYGELKLTGTFDIFEVKHTEVDLLNYKIKIKKLVQGITELYNKELNKL